MAREYDFISVPQAARVWGCTNATMRARFKRWQKEVPDVVFVINGCYAADRAFFDAQHNDTGQGKHKARLVITHPRGLPGGARWVLFSGFAGRGRKLWIMDLNHADDDAKLAAERAISEYAREHGLRVFFQHIELTKFI